MSSILPKNELENSNFCPSLLGHIFFVRFLGELKTPKSPFEINWPLQWNGKYFNLRTNFCHFLSQCICIGRILPTYLLQIFCSYAFREWWTLILFLEAFLYTFCSFFSNNIYNFMSIRQNYNFDVLANVWLEIVSWFLEISQDLQWLMQHDH